MKKFLSGFVLLMVSLRKINVAKAEPKTIVVPTRAHKSSEWIHAPKTSPATETSFYGSKGVNKE